jgi:predicted MFS family arabinose efflux permease
VWQLAALQAAYGAAEGFNGPASVAIVPQTVAPEDLQRANALLGLSDNAAAVLGPSLAGVIVATAGAGWGLAADAVTFALSAMLLLAMRVPGLASDAIAAVRADLLSELRAGWQAFRSRTWLWTTVLYFTLYVGLAYAPYLVLGPQIAKSALGGPGAWAAISASLGVGAVCGGLIGLRWRPRHPLRSAMSLFALSGPGLLVLLGLHAPLPALIAIAIFDGAASSLFNALWYTAMHSEVPAGELSRVTSWDYLGSLVLEPAGLALTGPIAVAIGFSATLYGAAGIAVMLTIAVLLVPAVRNFTIGAH